MVSRSKIGLKRVLSRGAEGCQQRTLQVLLPRLWMVLSVLAVPFIVVSAHYFETLERSGRLGAIIADTLMPATIISYLVFLYVLKQRKI